MLGQFDMTAQVAHDSIPLYSIYTAGARIEAVSARRESYRIRVGSGGSRYTVYSGVSIGTVCQV
jgi:hypothetical protein